MSVTDPRMPRTQSDAPEPPAPAPRERRIALGLLAAGVVAALVVFVVCQTYPNYDTYYTLVWGKELADGHLPDYDVFRTPTPHPLSTLVAWALAPFGTASDRILVLASLFGLLRLLRRHRTCSRSGCSAALIALLAVAVMLTRTDMQLLALRAMFDLPFYLMVFGAALLELRRPRCGWPVLALLGARRAAAAGGVAARRRLLALARPGHAAPALVRYALLVAAAPVLWMASDLIVTGEPLYSLTSTREVSGRVRPQPRACSRRSG